MATTKNGNARASATCRTENVINPKARRQAKPGMLRLTQSILLVSQHHRYTPPKRLRPSQVHGKSPPPLALWHRQGTRLTYIYRHGKLKLRRRGVVESHACHGVVVLHVRQDAVAASYLDKITSADGAVGQKGRGGEGRGREGAHRRLDSLPFWIVQICTFICSVPAAPQYLIVAYFVVLVGGG